MGLTKLSHKECSLHQRISHSKFAKSLERGICIGKELFKISLEPSTRLWSRLESIRISTVRIVSGRARVAGPVALTARLHPHKRIEETVARVGRGTNTEASSNDVAPVSPRILFRWLDAIARWDKSALHTFLI